MNRVIRTGIVGTGNLVSIADLHLLGYRRNPHAKVTAIYDVRYEWAQHWAKEKGLRDVRVCRTYEELLDSVDAVSICTPNFTHTELTCKALSAGKHVLCEKPISTSYEEGLPVLSCLGTPPPVNMTGFCYRGSPAVKYLKALIDEGMLGRIYYYREIMSRGRLADAGIPFEWRMDRKLSGGGALVDFGSHMVDLAEYLLEGSEGRITEFCGFSNTFIKERAKAGTSGMHPVENDDCAVFNGRTESGTLLSFTASRLGGIQHQIEITGSGGTVLYDEEKPLELNLQLKEINGAYGGEGKAVPLPGQFIPKPWLDEEKNRFIDEINRFISAVLKGESVQPDLKRGLYVQYMLNLAETAIKEGRTIHVEKLW